MSAPQKNKETISALYENGFNKRDLNFFHDLISPEYIGADGTKGAASFEGPIISLIRAMPDVQWKIQELLTEGEKVVARWKVQGTQTGIFNGFPATGRTVSSDGMAVFEFEGGKIIRITVQTDRLGFLQQIGVLPTDLSQLSKPVA